MANSMIKVVAYETSDPEVYAVVFKCLEQKVTKTNTCLHIMGDTSGSMQMPMGDIYEQNIVATTPSLAVPLPSLSLLSAPPSVPSLVPSPSLGYGAATPSLSLHKNENGNGIDPTSRLGAMGGFLDRILDMYQFIEDSQGIKQDLTISLFSDDCESYSTLDGLTYSQMRERAHTRLLNNGGTNFEAPLLELKKYREKFSGTTDSVFLSDGGHCSINKKREQIQEEFSKTVNLAIGIGSGANDFDEETLVKISDEFIAISDPKRMRDLVAKRAMDLVTMLGKDVMVKTVEDDSHVYYSNLNRFEDEKGNPEYKTKEMTMLMEFYMTITPDTKIQINYTLQNGETIKESFEFSEENENLFGDKMYGDKILFTLNTLKRIDNIKADLAELSNPQSKIAFIKSIKNEVHTSPFADMFANTRLGVYLNHLMYQLDRISLTQDDQVLLDLAKNVGSDAFCSASSESASAYCTTTAATPLLSPSVSEGTPSLTMLRASSSSTSATYGSKCLICTDDNAHRGVIYNPCGHFRTCTSCTVEWNKTSKQCPYCNGIYSGIILVNLSDEQKKDSWNMKCTTCRSRQIEIYSQDCGHVFSCRTCMSRQKKNSGKICCTVCKEQGIETEITKYKQIFM